jgi:hypothetical protein
VAWRRVIGSNVLLSRTTERWLRLPTDQLLWRRFEDQVAALIRGLLATRPCSTSGAAAGACMRVSSA